MGKKSKQKAYIRTEELLRCSNNIRPKVEKMISNLDFNLVEVLFEIEHHVNYLRITISHPHRNISLTDCELVSRTLEKELDAENLIPFSYTLEVQSPGNKQNRESAEKLEHSFTLKDLGLVVKS